MTNISSEVCNYFKLELLIARSCITLRQLFKNRYSLFNGGQVWNNSSTCGMNYLTNVIAKNKKISLTPIQKTSVSNGNSDEWDVTTLTALLLFIDRPKTLSTNEIQQLDQEDKLLQQLREIRNKLAHHGTKSVDDIEFNQLWTDLAAVLVAFGDTDTELDKLKDNSVFESPKQPINEENVKEALRLNSLGTKAHKDGNYSEAIIFFTKATVLPGVSNHDRAIFYSNRAASRLSLYEQRSSSSSNIELSDATDQRYRALQDAKQARNLWSTWWKGHFRVGKVYAALNEHEKAINSFERAFALDPAYVEIQKALDDSRQILSQQSRFDHLDPRMTPGTMAEQLNYLQQNFGTDPEKVRIAHDLLEKIDPAGADVVKGHKYEHGDVDIKQDYEQAAKYFGKAASQGNAEGIYNLGRLTNLGLGVKKDHNLAFKLFQQAAAQSPQHPILKQLPNIGVIAAEHSLGLMYADGIGVHKNLSTAAYWYQRATDHGSAQSANNLALMYQHGTGVNKDLEKAEQLLQLSARGGDQNAMQTLAELLLNKDDFQMAKIWYDRACEAGNVLAQIDRDMFENMLQKRQQLISQCSPDVLKIVNACKNMLNSADGHKSVCNLSGQPLIYDYNLLEEHANRGSLTAKIMCNALEHFGHALIILTENETLTEDEENIFVHELSQCYRLEHIVAQIPGPRMRQKIDEIIDRVLRRCSAESTNAVSQIDEDARICYAVLHMDSHKLIAQFLDPCKQKYPKSIIFFELSSAVNGWLGQYEKSLYEANAGLHIDPNYCELLYFKAVALRLIGKDMNETIKAYHGFLVVAPKDHRKVPESYYAMASCYLMLYKEKGIQNIIKKTYEEGEQAEKLQLPCFLPYESTSKTLIKPVINPESLLNTEPIPPINRKLRLSDPHRIEIITQHREWENRVSQMKNNVNFPLTPTSHEPRVKQQTAKSLIGLKLITLKEMNPTKDQVYNGYVLSATIIEEAYSSTPSIHLVIEDENLDCERMFIYSFPEGQGEYLTSKIFTNGSKMHIINPYLRIGANDMKPLIRIDDFSSIIMQSESERVINMCRCCGEANAPHVCSKCKQAHYCTKECQTMDENLYKHEFICQIK